MKSDWIWMPHPGHFIASGDCKYHLNTFVNGYIVSTVGEYLPGDAVREIIATSRKVKLNGIGDARDADYMKKIGYEELGFGRLYETMVFKAKADPENGCCPFTAADWSNIDFAGYKKPADAFRGHIEMCEKYDAAR